MFPKKLCEQCVILLQRFGAMAPGQFIVFL